MLFPISPALVLVAVITIAAAATDVDDVSTPPIVIPRVAAPPPSEAPTSRNETRVVEPDVVATESVPGTNLTIRTVTKRTNTSAADRTDSVIPAESNATTGEVDGQPASDSDLHLLDRTSDITEIEVSMPTADGGVVTANLVEHNVSDTTTDMKQATNVGDGLVGSVLMSLAQGLMDEGKASTNTTMIMSMANNTVAVSSQSSNHDSQLDVVNASSPADLDAIRSQLNKPGVALTPISSLVVKKLDQVEPVAPTIVTPVGISNVPMDGVPLTPSCIGPDCRPTTTTVFGAPSPTPASSLPDPASSPTPASSLPDPTSSTTSYISPSTISTSAGSPSTSSAPTTTAPSSATTSTPSASTGSASPPCFELSSASTLESPSSKSGTTSSLPSNLTSASSPSATAPGSPSSPSPSSTVSSGRPAPSSPTTSPSSSSNNTLASSSPATTTPTLPSTLSSSSSSSSSDSTKRSLPSSTGRYMPTAGKDPSPATLPGPRSLVYYSDALNMTVAGANATDLDMDVSMTTDTVSLTTLKISMISPMRSLLSLPVSSVEQHQAYPNVVVTSTNGTDVKVSSSVTNLSAATTLTDVDVDISSLASPIPDIDMIVSLSALDATNVGVTVLETIVEERLLKLTTVTVLVTSICSFPLSSTDVIDKTSAPSSVPVNHTSIELIPPMTNVSSPSTTPGSRSLPMTKSRSSPMTNVSSPSTTPGSRSLAYSSDVMNMTVESSNPTDLQVQVSMATDDPTSIGLTTLTIIMMSPMSSLRPVFSRYERRDVGVTLVATSTNATDVQLASSLTNVSSSATLTNVNVDITSLTSPITTDMLVTFSALDATDISVTVFETIVERLSKMTTVTVVVPTTIRSSSSPSQKTIASLLHSLSSDTIIASPSTLSPSLATPPDARSSVDRNDRPSSSAETRIASPSTSSPSLARSPDARSLVYFSDVLNMTVNATNAIDLDMDVSMTADGGSALNLTTLKIRMLSPISSLLPVVVSSYERHDAGLNVAVMSTNITDVSVASSVKNVTSSTTLTDVDIDITSLTAPIADMITTLSALDAAEVGVTVLETIVDGGLSKLTTITVAVTTIRQLPVHIIADRPNSSIRTSTSPPSAPVRSCPHGYQGVSVDAINAFVDEAKLAIPDFSILEIATCEQIAEFIIASPPPTMATPDFCRMLGVPASSSSPIIAEIASIVAPPNTDGFLWVLLPPIPIDVISISQATTMTGAIYADGSLRSSGTSIMGVTSTLDGPLFAQLEGFAMVAEPVANSTSKEADDLFPLPFVAGDDDDELLGIFGAANDDGPTSARPVQRGVPAMAKNM